MNLELKTSQLVPVNDRSDCQKLLDLLNLQPQIQYSTDAYPLLLKDDYSTWIDDYVSNVCRTIYMIKESEKIVGVVELERGENIYHFSGIVNYFIIKTNRAEEVLSDAISRVCKMGFSDWRLFRISTSIFDNNEGAISILEGAGFKLEGVVKYNAYCDDQLWDEFCYVRFHEI